MSRITVVTTEEITYADQTTHYDGEVTQYSCFECGLILKDSQSNVITGHEELLQWLTGEDRHLEQHSLRY